MNEVQAVVIGAGVVGLAIARALARAGKEVVILEAEDAIGTHTSSRNSEVIHAGIYYPKGSLKASSCVRGKVLLYEYCDSHGVPYRRCGKLIVATEAQQVQELESIKAKAHANGVTDVDFIPAEEAMRWEPDLRCVAALHSPSTGIIDSHALMLAYLGDAEAHGAMLALKSRFHGAERVPQGFVVHVDDETFRCALLVNSAGLRAPSVAKTIEGYETTRAQPGAVDEQGAAERLVV
ncbi:MAG TPA: FAD-dependent oxidoreductase, partial [Burkholderiales bacterium]|nr:FAD-dependent oxidoreductase [Burkholderiales bacterium]